MVLRCCPIMHMRKPEEFGHVLRGGGCTDLKGDMIKNRPREIY